MGVTEDDDDDDDGNSDWRCWSVLLLRLLPPGVLLVRLELCEWAERGGLMKTSRESFLCYIWHDSDLPPTYPVTA